MVDPAGPHPGPPLPPPGWRLPPVVYPPAAMAPTGPPRPRYREPHPVRARGLLAGIGAATGWLLLFGLLGGGLPGYLWYTFLAGLVAWLLAALLVRLGDRGVAVGVAMTTAVGWSVAAGVAAVQWAFTGDWPMW